MGGLEILSIQNEVAFLSGNKRVTVADGKTLLDAVRLVGLTVEAPCDGRGTCGKCHVKVTGAVSPPNENEVEQLGDLLASGVRLACQTKVHGQVQVELLASRGDTFIALDKGKSNKQAFNPPISKISLDISDSQECQGALCCGLEPFFKEYFPAILRELSNKYTEALQHCEVIVKNGKVLDVSSELRQDCLGIALDIGTTSVVAELVDLMTGHSLGVQSCLNPQSEYGGDVLTRISYAAKHVDGTIRLQEKIIEAINRLIHQLTAEQALDNRNIYEIVVAGNTTMLHLLLGINPRSLARSPFRPIFRGQMDISSASLGVHMATRGVVTLLPSASAFIGADIVAGLLAVNLHHYAKTALFIDIGTNGEIALCKNGQMVGTSSAAGPALEGMNITCGCRAENGVIEGVTITGEGNILLSIIGNEPPIGICGSGLIDLISELVRVGVIQENGRFACKEKLRPHLASHFVDLNGKQVFVLTEDGAVYLTQKDIRQVQLAKGAISAAITLLLNKLNVGTNDIDEVFVAGAFGFHLKPSSLTGIGLLPLAYEDKIRYVGNTAKEGAKAILLNQDAASEVLQICESIEIVELSLTPEFQQYFVGSLSFRRL